MAKVSTKRSERRGRGADDLEELEMPAPTTQQSGPAMPAGPQMQQVAAAPPMASSSGGGDLARHEIKDSLAMGGVSALEMQHRLQTDVYMTDEDRRPTAETPEVRHLVLRPSQWPFQCLPGTQLQRPPAGEANLFAPASSQAPHSAPIGGNAALGAEGALAPQGVNTPQGLLTSVGMLGLCQRTSGGAERYAPRGF